MAHVAFTPDAAESISTPASDAQSVSSPITPRDTHPAYSPSAIYSRSTGQPSPSARSVHSVQSGESSTGKRRLGLLEYPTVHEDLQFCREVRDKFTAYQRDNPTATPLDLEQVALTSLAHLRATFEDMCHIPPPECVFYQWSYRQAHSADAATSGGDVFHLLHAHCYMFDYDPNDTGTSFPVPDQSQVMAVINLVGCQPTSLMLAFGLRRGLRRSTTEGREIFWTIYSTLADLSSTISEEFLRAQPFLDRSVQLMATVRAQRGATGALAYSGVFPTRAEVSYAMEMYAAESRAAAEKAGAGLALSSSARRGSSLNFTMHRLDRLFQGIEVPDDGAPAASIAQSQTQPQQLFGLSPLLLAENIGGADKGASPHVPHPSSDDADDVDDADAQEDRTPSTNSTSASPVMTDRILQRSSTTDPPITPAEVTIAHASSARPASDVIKDSPQPTDPSTDASRPTPRPARASHGRLPTRRRVPPLATISCGDVSELLKEENKLHEKFLDFVARFHDNVTEDGARSLESLVQQHTDLLYHREQQQCRRELAARLHPSRGTPYYSHHQPQPPTQATTGGTASAGVQGPAANSTGAHNNDGGNSSRNSNNGDGDSRNSNSTSNGNSNSNSGNRDTNRGSHAPGYVYIDIPSLYSSAAYTGNNFGNIFTAPPAPDPFAYHIHNQPGRLRQPLGQNYPQHASAPSMPAPPPPYEPASQRLQPAIGPPIPYNLSLPSLDQTEVVAPQPLRPTLPALAIPPPTPVPRSLIESRLRDGARTEGYATLLEALHALPPAPLAEQNEMARQQYERYHQQQQYQLELQRQSQEQDRMMQTYQEQRLQHQRHILTQQAIIQREQLAQLEYMQHQHQVHLLRTLHTHVLQEADAQRRAHRDSTPGESRTPSNDDDDPVFNTYTGLANEESDVASDVHDDDPEHEEDDYPSVPVLAGYDEDEDVSYIPPFAHHRTVDDAPPDVANTEPPLYTVSQNRPAFGDVSSLPIRPVAMSSSTSPLRAAIANARNGTEVHDQRDTDGAGSSRQDADEDETLYG
ncbi:uncharacterized protein SPSK_05885 [Sporothrix schenckii 1099-18]|uniref:Uncharacterized protein n=1 Tax=Sporothrix schenckii 1099-18 TaxID=1397361 RepID=A0A0F2MN59_SPOSC|nr:uncharacterized protein SPSK_05885 [Sporothrix schenckii 1099-18]KJR89616.1 hypothetical protein SPSK_05885 [Sporothrix schenckii 1099-18]